MSFKLIVTTLIGSTSFWACGSTPEPEAVQFRSDEKVEITVQDDVFTKCGLPQDRAYFDVDSTALDYREQAFLAGVASCMKTGPLSKSSILLTGDADKQGPEGYNKDLALARARVVAVELWRRGVPSERIYVRAQGEKDALFDQQRRMDYDRRVELSRVESN
jgi:outer membrane protein OmpA-like peptidoglycan-associated protein